MRASTRLACLACIGALLSAGACTRSAGEPTRTPSSPHPSATATVVGPVHFQPGEYRYAFGGVAASLSFSGSSATLEVKNTSGAELAPPGLYVIDGKGARHDGTVAAAATIPDGGTATFQVTFPDVVTARTIGLVILEFGSENWGAFAPAPVA